MNKIHAEASLGDVTPKKRSKSEAFSEKEKRSFRTRWEDFLYTTKKVHTPPLKDWRRDFKWVLVVVAGAITVIMGVDWLALMGRDKLVELLPPIGGGSPETLFTVIYFAVGALTVVSVLLLRGSTAGLSSLLGSSVEFGAMSSANFEKRVTRFMIVMASAFVLMTIFSPLFLS